MVFFELYILIHATNEPILPEFILQRGRTTRRAF